jgi:hypothetical protein
MYQLVVINPKGATVRTGPSTSGGEIRPAVHGEPLPIFRLIFAQRQAFDENYIPAFIEALKRGTVRGDVWAQISEMQTYHNEPVTGYVALRVNGTIYGALVGSVEPSIPPAGGAYDEGLRDGEKIGFEKSIQLLAVERAKLP